MERGGISMQKYSRESSRGLSTGQTMKNSTPTYTSSIKKNGHEYRNLISSQKAGPRNYYNNYDFSNNALKSLLNEKNTNIMDQPRDRKNYLNSQMESKKDYSKKQFRIRTKDNPLANSRKTDQQDEDKSNDKQHKAEKQKEITSTLKKPKEELDTLQSKINGSSFDRTSSKLKVYEKKEQQNTVSAITVNHQRRASGITNTISNSYSTSKKLGLVGLNNIGNTCFMNSTLQCILNLPSFNEYFLEGLHSREMKSNARVAEAYAKLIRTIRNSSNGSETPSELKSVIGSKRSRFLGYAQQDAQQFLVALLELLSIDLNRAKNPKYQQLTADLQKNSLSEISQQWWKYNKQREDSIVCDYFSGQIVSKVVCSRCSNQSIAFDNFWDMALNFSARDEGDILKMVQNFLKEETISSDYYCSKCKSFRECKRKIDIYRLPKILIFQIKRFSYGSWRKTKLNNRVKVETELDLSNVIYKSSDDPSTKDPVYNLVGVVNHSGGIDFGHYTAECKNPINGKWYNFNDSSVHETRMREYFESSSPYVLFYAKKNL